MSQTTPIKIIPIFTSNGDPKAFLLYPYIFNRDGDWIGFVTAQRDVYSVLGSYVGMLTDDPRIIRKLNEEQLPSLKPPARPHRIRIPFDIPLAKLMPDLAYPTIDVLTDRPKLLHTTDANSMLKAID